MWSHLNRLVADTSGNVALLFGIAVIPIFASMGMALDYNRGSSAQMQLSAALDAATLAVARSGRMEDEEAIAFLENYLSDQLAGIGFNGSWDITAFDQSENRVSATVTGTLDTVMLGLIGFEDMPIGVDTVVVRDQQKVELALVLDNTGSMNSKNKIGALRDAAAALVDIMYQGEEAEQNVKISLVPFVTSVNIKAPGAFQMSWMDTDAKAAFHGVNFDAHGATVPNHFELFEAMDVAWKGCVEARAEPYDVDITPPDPSNPDTLFVPWLWPDEPNQHKPNRYKSGGNGASAQDQYDNDYLEDVVTAQNAEARQRSIEKYYAGNTPEIDEIPSDTKGPNRSCGQPLVPLTNDANLLHSEIGAMRGWNQSGTNIAQGLVWGWNVLSPTEPFTQAVPYEETDTLKALVLLSDGENLVVGNSKNHNKSDYNGYNYLAVNRLGTTNQSQAASRVNDKVEELCAKIKDKNIRVYTILFDLNKQNLRTLFRECATRPELYFDNPTNAELKSVFEEIAYDLSNLRIAK